MKKLQLVVVLLVLTLFFVACDQANNSGGSTVEPAALSYVCMNGDVAATEAELSTEVTIASVTGELKKLLSMSFVGAMDVSSIDTWTLDASLGRWNDNTFELTEAGVAALAAVLSGEGVQTATDVVNHFDGDAIFTKIDDTTLKADISYYLR